MRHDFTAYLKRFICTIWREPLVCFMAILVLNGCEGYETVIEGLSQRDTYQALLILRDHNIDASKEMQASKKNVLYAIKTKKTQARQALSLLIENGIPHEERARLKDVYPPGSQGFIPSKSDEQARFVMALQGEIENLLKTIPGIIDARVIFSQEPSLDFKNSQPKKSASVVIVHKEQNNESLLPVSEEEIKLLVAASFSGLLPEDIAIVQKIIRSPALINHELSSKSISSHNEVKFDWGLLVLTLLSLVVASYGIVRLYLMRRGLGRDKQ